MIEMQSYIAWANDKNALKSSASGAVFQALAKMFLLNAKSGVVEGSVYGAWQDNAQFIVLHRGVDDPEDINLLIGSKYYQSELQTVFIDIKNKLKVRQKILFSGTPCQVAGLKSYLRCSGIIADGNLLTIEVLCHGVSSRKVVMHYVDWIEERAGKKVQQLLFRTKKRRWYDKGSSMEVHYDDGTEQVIDRHIDPFYLVYNNSMSLRPSCYSCRFAKIDRIADITIGDFWGAENFINDEQKLYDGIGLVMINSEIGRELWDCAQNTITAESLDIKKAIPRNGAIIKSVTEPASRQKFFDGLEKYNFGELVEKCFGRNRLFKIRIKGAIGEERIRKFKQMFRRN